MPQLRGLKVIWAKRLTDAIHFFAVAIFSLDPAGQDTEGGNEKMRKAR